MVGSVREVVQRALKTLEDAGLIQMARGRIQIIDAEALDGWSESESSLLRPVSRNEAGANRFDESVEHGWRRTRGGRGQLSR
jgi:hypothetical protein